MNTGDKPINKRSFRLGIIYCFCEMVEMGVKKLALSSPLQPKEYEELKTGSEKIAADFGVKSWLEKEFLVTDLFTEEITKNKWVILYYKSEDVLQEYLDMKQKKQELIDAGNYAGEARKSVAAEFGRLLSYPESNIEEMLAEGPKSIP
ncbi:MAG: hypothetical protein ACYS8W_04190 [Planctomycetota bacterium]|jgi:hypothetical protein